MTLQYCCIAFALERFVSFMTPSPCIFINIDAEWSNQSINHWKNTSSPKCQLFTDISQPIKQQNCTHGIFTAWQGHHITGSLNSTLWAISVNNMMPSTWKTELQGDRGPAGRLADRKTGRQMDKLKKKKGNEYIWCSDSDIMPVSCVHTHARVCVCVTEWLCVKRCKAAGGFT